MAKVKKDNNGFIAFKCPGCGFTHSLNVVPGKSPHCWKFNGKFDKPTFHPSILERCGHYVPKQPQPPNCVFCTEAAKEGYEPICMTCHSWVTDGNIQFLNDCTHALAGKTVPLPEI